MRLLPFLLVLGLVAGADGRTHKSCAQTVSQLEDMLVDLSTETDRCKVSIDKLEELVLQENAEKEECLKRERGLKRDLRQATDLEDLLLQADAECDARVQNVTQRNKQLKREMQQTRDMLNSCQADVAVQEASPALQPSSVSTAAADIPATLAKPNPMDGASPDTGQPMPVAPTSLSNPSPPHDFSPHSSPNSGVLATAAPQPPLCNALWQLHSEGISGGARDSARSSRLVDFVWDPTHWAPVLVLVVVIVAGPFALMWRYVKRLECDLAKRDKILFIERELSQRYRQENSQLLQKVQDKESYQKEDYSVRLESLQRELNKLLFLREENRVLQARLAAHSDVTVATPAPTPVKAKGEHKPKPCRTPTSTCGSDPEGFAQAMSLLASMAENSLMTQLEKGSGSGLDGLSDKDVAFLFELMGARSRPGSDTEGKNSSCEEHQDTARMGRKPCSCRSPLESEVDNLSSADDSVSPGHKLGESKPKVLWVAEKADRRRALPAQEPALESDDDPDSDVDSGTPESFIAGEDLSTAPTVSLADCLPACMPECPPQAPLQVDAVSAQPLERHRLPEVGLTFCLPDVGAPWQCSRRTAGQTIVLHYLPQGPAAAPQPHLVVLLEDVPWDMSLQSYQDLTLWQLQTMLQGNLQGLSDTPCQIAEMEGCAIRYLQTGPRCLYASTAMSLCKSRAIAWQWVLQASNPDLASAHRESVDRLLDQLLATVEPLHS